MSKKTYIERPPRIQPELPKGIFDIPNPPEQDENPNSIIMQVALPIITVFGYVLVAMLGAGRSMLLIIPMGIAAVASTIMALIASRNEKRIRIQKELAFTQRLIELRREMDVQHDMQRIFYTYNYPDAEKTLGIASDIGQQDHQKQQDIRSGSRLWERRTSDDDFASLRLGIGTRASSVIYKMPDADNYDNPQIRDAIRLSEESKYIYDVPITIGLRHVDDEEAAIPQQQEGGKDVQPEINRFAVGITGKNKNHIYRYIWTTLLDYTAFHSPNDTQLYIIGSNKARGNWRWAYPLPHCKKNDQTETLAFESDQTEKDEDSADRMRFFLKDLRNILEHRKIRLEDRERGGDITIPFLLLIVDVLDEVPSWSALKDLESDATISTILQEGKRLGAAVLFLVPDRSQIPSNCQAVLEVDPDPTDPNSIVFRYAEIDINTLRYVGRNHIVPADQTVMDFAKKLEPLAVRRSYGADLASSVTLLEMLNTPAIDILRSKTTESWKKSAAPEYADWTFGEVGLLSGNEVRKLVYSAKADGVHGLIAGSTGSGKSELLTTMILSLALNFDPNIVNFVLVDYKGGAAFEPFKNLPHCVDIVTNLEGSATARMFASITAEMDRRQRLNTFSNSKDIVHYRKKGLHLKEDSQPYPHLFIIIDEFAEMIAGNPEFKAQLESITRLGRALGVTLILAAQRPIGVTDQMRANIKFRICLRVETPDDSRELLRRSDAAYLPPGIPGRGYLQVGNENVELIQTGWSGSDYKGEQEAASPNIIWLDRPRKSSKQLADEPPKVFEVVIDMMDNLSKEISDPQWRPWPKFLPKDLSLETPVDMGYMSDEHINFITSLLREDTSQEFISLNETISYILSNKFEWKGVHWLQNAMRPVIGLIDNPYEATQLPLVINFPVGHAVLFGASGWGKTTFLRTLVLSLVATHSPDELQIYIMEFGGRNLNVFKNLPHVGAVITGDEEERIQRLLRKINSMLEERQLILSEAGSNDIYTFNQTHPEETIPPVLVAIDNFAEFRENFEGLMGTMIALVRESRAYGIHFVFTANQPNTLPGKLFNLITERMTLKLSDAGEYSTVVGRGMTDMGDIAGRGLIKIGRMPLEFQTALPMQITEDDRMKNIDESEKLKQYVQKIQDFWADGWRDKAPATIETLDIRISMDNMLKRVLEKPKRGVVPPIGIDDRTLEPYFFDIAKMGPHSLVIGPPNSGKTTTLRSLVLSIAKHYTPEEIMIVLVDFQRRLFQYGGNHTLDELPHVVQAVSRPEDLDTFLKDLEFESKSMRENIKSRKIFVLIDNYDSFSDEGSRKNRDFFPDLAIVAREYGTDGLHFIGCGSISITGANDELRKQLTSSSFGLALQTADAAGRLNGKVPRSLASVELPMGRGFMIKSGRTHMVQIATPYSSDDEIEESMDQWIERLLKQNKKFEKLVWSRPPEEESENGNNEKTVDDATMKTYKEALKEHGISDEIMTTMSEEDILNMAKEFGIIE
ncbi:MAG: hypothetical protein JEZ06_09880 [Anaerolineaceae bacterium]|nr:hypothetical protein [Anaerolineaceae bacterium]